VAGVRDYTELHVWKLSDDMRSRVRQMLSKPAFRRDVELHTQLRSAADSACTNVAEGFSRYHPRDFARFLRTTKGSLSETIEHVASALALGYISDAEAQEACSLARRARGAATRLIMYLETADAPNAPRGRPPRSRR
jgi:four helix bundle protein